MYFFQFPGVDTFIEQLVQRKTLVNGKGFPPRKLVGEKINQKRTHQLQTRKPNECLLKISGWGDVFPVEIVPFLGEMLVFRGCNDSLSRKNIRVEDII